MGVVEWMLSLYKLGTPTHPDRRRASARLLSPDLGAQRHRRPLQPRLHRRPPPAQRGSAAAPPRPRGGALASGSPRPSQFPLSLRLRGSRDEINDGADISDDHAINADADDHS